MMIHDRYYDFIVFLIYIDDIIATSNNSILITALIVKLNSIFSLEDLGELNYFLGVEVTHNADGFQLSQGKYIHGLLDHVQLHDAKIITTLMVSSQQLSKHDGESLSNASLYHILVGAL